MTAAAPARVIFHIDVDAFFVQVERQNDPSLRGVPVCVRQHEDVVAVSYEARELGIRKHMSPARIRAEHPSVRLVHVLAVDAKVSYRHYRAASRAIFATITAFAAPDVIVEKRGMDEAFLDVTVRAGGGDGSLLAQELRSCIASDTGYTCSVGVAHNKLLAKLASRAAKPDGVCVMTRDRIATTLATHRVRDVPGFGGAVAAAVSRATGIEFLHQLATAPLVALEAALNGTGVTVAALLAASHGLDDSTVTATGPPRSLQSQMSLSPLVLPDATATAGRALEPIAPYDAVRVRSMMRTLAEDAFDRVQEDMEEHARYPTQMTVGVQLYTCSRDDIAAAGRVFPCAYLPVAHRDALVQHVEALEARTGVSGTSRSHVSCVDVMDGAAVHWPCCDAAPARGAGYPPWLTQALTGDALTSGCSCVLAFVGQELKRCAGQPTSRSAPFPVEACGIRGTSAATSVSALLDACMRIYSRVVHAALAADGWRMAGDDGLTTRTRPLYAELDKNRRMDVYTLPVAVVKLNVAVTAFAPGLPTAPISSFFVPTAAVQASAFATGKRGREAPALSPAPRKRTEYATVTSSTVVGPSVACTAHEDASRAPTPAIVVDIVSPPAAADDKCMSHLADATHIRTIAPESIKVDFPVDSNAVDVILTRISDAPRVRLSDLLRLDAAVAGRMLTSHPGVIIALP